MNLFSFNNNFQYRMYKNHLKLFSKVVDKEFLTSYNKVKKNTMLPIERLYDLYKSVLYINSAQIPGAIVEVGCYRGGALALASLAEKTGKRKIFGFDTFDGHLQPNQDEFDIHGNSSYEYFQKLQSKNIKWAYANLDQVKRFIAKVDPLNSKRIKLIKGDIKKIRETVLPPPKKFEIAILRIDTDWYPETKVALELWYPMLSKNGVIILDDYGHHSGQREATNEFFSNKKVKFTHVDYSCITAIKPN